MREAPQEWALAAAQLREQDVVSAGERSGTCEVGRTRAEHTVAVVPQRGEFVGALCIEASPRGGQHVRKPDGNLRVAFARCGVHHVERRTVRAFIARDPAV